MGVSRFEAEPNFNTHLTGAQDGDVINDQRNREEATKRVNNFVDLLRQFNQGIPPSNEQIYEFLDSMKTGLDRASTSPRITPKGQEVIHDSKSLMDSTKHLFQEKNNDQLFQGFFVSSSAAAANAQRKRDALKVQNATLKTSRNSLVNTGKSGYNIMMLVFGSSAFRNLVIEFLEAVDDAVEDAREVEYTAARKQKKEASVNNSTENQDPSATQGSQAASPEANNAPAVDASAPAVDASAPAVDASAPAVDASAPAVDASAPAVDASAPAVDASAPAVDASAAADIVNDAARKNIENKSKGVSNIAGQSGFRILLDSVQGKTSLKNTVKTSIQDFFGLLVKILKSDTAISPDVRNRLRSKFSGFVNEVSNNENYMEAVNNILNFFTFLREDLGSTVKQATLLKSASEDDELTLKAMGDFRELIERFSGGCDLDKTTNSLKVLYNNCQSDQNIQEFLPDCVNFFNKTFQNPSYVESEPFKTESQAVIDKARVIYKRYANDPDWQTVSRESRAILLEIKHDPALNEWQNAWENTTKHFLMADSMGKYHLNHNTLNEVKDVFVPIIAEQLKYIAIPTINYSDEKIDIRLSQIVFSGYDVLPEQVSVKTDLVWNSSVRDYVMESSSAFSQQQIAMTKTPRGGKSFSYGNSQSKVYINLNNIRAHVRDLAFFYNRKVFPAITDEGLVNVNFNKGVDVNVELIINSDKDAPQGLFQGGKVRTTVHGLKVQVTKAKHKALYRVGLFMFNGLIQRQIESVISDQILEGLQKMTERLNVMYAKVPATEARSKFFDMVKNFAP